MEFLREDFDCCRLDGGNKPTVNRRSDDRRLAIFTAPLTPLSDRLTCSFCAFFRGMFAPLAQKELQYAPFRFITTSCPVPDPAPSGLDRRHRTCPPSGPGRPSSLLPGRPPGL